MPAKAGLFGAVHLLVLEDVNCSEIHSHTLFCLSLGAGTKKCILFLFGNIFMYFSLY